MLDDGHFLLTYNKDEIRTGKKDFPKPKWTVYNFSCNKIVAIEAQIYSQNYRKPSQPYAACDYSFCL